MGVDMEAATAIAEAGTLPGVAAIGPGPVEVEGPTVAVERRHSFACSCGHCPPGPVLRTGGARHRIAAARRRPAFGWFVALGAAAVVAVVLVVVFAFRDPNAAAADHTARTAGLPVGSPLSLSAATAAPSSTGVPRPTLLPRPGVARASALATATAAAPVDSAPYRPAAAVLTITGQTTVAAVGSAGADVAASVETSPSTTPKSVAESSGQSTDPAPIGGGESGAGSPVVTPPATFSAGDALTALLVCQAALGPAGHARTPAVGSTATAPPATGWPCYVDSRPTTPDAATAPSTDTATGG